MQLGSIVKQVGAGIELPKQGAASRAVLLGAAVRHQVRLPVSDTFGKMNTDASCIGF